MSEIEKMYRNSGIKKRKKTMLDAETGKDVLTLDSFYPEFTAEKQLSLMICLINFETQVVINKELNQKITREDIQEVLAKITNNIWQGLTEKEKQQVREILD